MASNPPLDSSQAQLEIAHVLFMDIVAYSRLPMEQQTRLSVELQSLVRDSSEFQRAEQHDQLLRLPTGDGMALIFFGDPEAPVRCALEVSRAMHKHPELKLRMGIHSGPVQRIDDINASRNVSGAGINYAQRVMDCGDAGHILVSRAVAEVIGETSRWNSALHDIGQVEVKHGAHLHLFNLYGEGFGNAEVPQKVRQQQEQATETGRLQTVKARQKRRRWSVVAISVGVVVVVMVAATFYTRRAHALTDKDTIVLADFTNKTGDPVFDDTLKQGLSVALSQSPFLKLLSDEKVNDTLKMMGGKLGERLTPEVAQEVCLRTNNKAMLGGSISTLGSQYVIGLKAIHCIDGDVIAQEQVQAGAKEQVLKALDKAATSLRGKLGESVTSIKRFDTPLLEATTPSLEALKAFTVASSELISASTKTWRDKLSGVSVRESGKTHAFGTQAVQQVQQVPEDAPRGNRAEMSRPLLSRSGLVRLIWNGRSDLETTGFTVLANQLARVAHSNLRENACPSASSAFLC